MSPIESHPPRGKEAPSFRFSLSDIPVPMVCAAYRIIRDCNHAFAGLFGYERKDLIDQSFARLYPKISDFARTGRMWQEHLHGGHSYYDERVMTHQTGARFWCQVNGRTLQPNDPFALALYCFQKMNRSIDADELQLTARQRQIMALVAQGKTNAEIGLELGLSKRTIESHRARLMLRVGASNGAELVSWFS